MTGPAAPEASGADAVGVKPIGAGAARAVPDRREEKGGSLGGAGRREPSVGDETVPREVKTGGDRDIPPLAGAPDQLRRAAGGGSGRDGKRGWPGGTAGGGEDELPVDVVCGVAGVGPGADSSADTSARLGGCLTEGIPWGGT